MVTAAKLPALCFMFVAWVLFNCKSSDNALVNGELACFRPLSCLHNNASSCGQLVVCREFTLRNDTSCKKMLFDAERQGCKCYLSKSFLLLHKSAAMMPFGTGLGLSEQFWRW